MILKYVRNHPYAKLEMPKTAGSSGYDIYTPIIEKIEPCMAGKLVILNTMIAIEITDKNYYIEMLPRSSFAKLGGIFLPNSIGIIDQDFRGNLKAFVYVIDKYFDYNELTQKSYFQLIIKEKIIAHLEEAEELSETERGDGGYGSTDLAEARAREWHEEEEE